jgi:hypothetical protein
MLGMFALCICLTWLTFNFWRRLAWQERVRSMLEGWAAQDSQASLGLPMLSAVFTVFAFLLFVWSVTGDAYYLAYLTRFGPVLLFGTLVSLQTFVLALLTSAPQYRAAWTWSLAAGVALVMFQGWSLIWFNQLGNIALVIAMLSGTFYAQEMIRRGYRSSRRVKLGWLLGVLIVVSLVSIQFYFIPKRFLVYAQSFLVYSPMAVVWLVILTHAVGRLSAALHSHVIGRALIYLAVFAGFVYAGNLYYQAGKAHAQQVNTAYRPNDDEEAFMDFAVKVRESDFRFTGWRNQMPVYPFIQALFYDSNMTMEDFFGRGKEVNISLSLISLAVVFMIAQRFLPLDLAVNLTLITAFGLYVFKSGYFLVELLYYTVAFLAYALLCALLIKPSRTLSVAAGIVLGIGHLTKASILPTLLLFTGIFLLKELLPGGGSAYAKGALWQRSKPALLNLGIVVICFTAVISPYIMESKRLYGSYFYNVNSAFLWYDSYGEALEGTLAGKDLPLPVVYLQTHSLGDIWERLEDGLHWQAENIRYQYGFFNYPVFLTLFMFLAALLDVRHSLQAARKYPLVLPFAILYFAAYFFLCIWYSPIANLPRFLYVMYAPFAFSVFMAIKHLSCEINRPLIRMTSLALFAMTMIDIWHTLSRGPFFRDFGS